MAISVVGGGRKARRRQWPAGEVARLAEKAFELATTAPHQDVARCSWCRAQIEPGGDGYCSAECAQAVRVAGLYLG